MYLYLLLSSLLHNPFILGVVTGRLGVSAVDSFARSFTNHSHRHRHWGLKLREGRGGGEGGGGEGGKVTLHIHVHVHLDLKQMLYQTLYTCTCTICKIQKFSCKHKNFT